MLNYKDTPQTPLIIFEDHSEFKGKSCVGIGERYNDNIVTEIEIIFGPC